MSMDLDLTIDCPDCGGTIKTSLNAVAQEKTVRCSRGHSVRLRDEGRGARGTVRALNDLEKSLKKLGR